MVIHYNRLLRYMVRTMSTIMEYHDKHYKALGIEPWQIMKANFTKEERIGFYKGNILKYLLRNKDGIKDIDKLINYAIELRKELENETV